MSTSSSPTNHRPYVPSAAIVAALAVAMSLSGSPPASASATEHNARVAEYLLQLRVPEYRNARVAEYQQLQRKAAHISGLHSSH